MTNDGSTATDGTTTQNNKVTQTAKKVLAGNQQVVSTYLEEKGKYEATVKQATELNQAVEAAAIDLEKKDVTVNICDTYRFFNRRRKNWKKQND